MKTMGRGIFEICVERGGGRGEGEREVGEEGRVRWRERKGWR